jgi:hypothetical protein
MSEDIAFQLVRSWRLMSYSAVTSGETIYPLGRSPQVRLTYEPGGRMAVQLADSSCAPFLTADPGAATDQEVSAAFASYLAYYGSYIVDADRGVVVHHLEQSLIPNWTGGDQVRHFDLQGTQLTLQTPPTLIGGAERISTLVWEKLP